MFAKPRKETVGFTPMYNVAVPSNPVITAKISAPRLEMRLRTKGRLRVRDIFASWAGSRSMFRVFADAEARAVPVVKNRRVKAERDGEEVAVVVRRGGIG